MTFEDGAVFNGEIGVYNDVRFIKALPTRKFVTTLLRLSPARFSVQLFENDVPKEKWFFDDREAAAQHVEAIKILEGWE